MSLLRLRFRYRKRRQLLILKLNNWIVIMARFIISFHDDIDILLLELDLFPLAQVFLLIVVLVILLIVLLIILLAAIVFIS